MVWCRSINNPMILSEFYQNSLWFLMDLLSIASGFSKNLIHLLRISSGCPMEYLDVLHGSWKTCSGWLWEYLTNASEVWRLPCELVTDQLLHQLLQIPHGFLKDFQGSFRVPPDFAMDSTRSFQDSLWVCYRFPTSTDSEITDIGLRFFWTWRWFFKGFRWTRYRFHKGSQTIVQGCI